MKLTLLGVVFTMDHEVVPRPCKFVIGCRTPPKTTSVHTKEENVKVTIECEVPKRHIILRSTLAIDMVQRVLRWKRQKRCFSKKRQRPVEEKYCCNQTLMIFLLGGGER